MSDPVKVLVVDDSAVMRKLIPQILERDGSIEVVGTAMDGSFGLRKVVELRPQVVTLDLEMPRMDGMEMLRQIMRQHRLPVIVVSAHTQEGAYSALKALALGAFDFVAKPRQAAGGHLGDIAAELAVKIKVAAIAGAPKMTFAFPPVRPKERKAAPRVRRPTRVVAIGVSTGGPNALQYVLAQLPEDFPGCLLLVQHMPEGFTEMFARRLDESSAVEVKEAQSGDLLLAGRVLICPGNRHMKVRRTPQGDVIILADLPRVNGHRPSVDVLFRSLAQEYGSSAAAVLMTGMGEDGVEGMGLVQARGGVTLAQSGESCVVDSMPRAAIERGYVSRVVPLTALAGVLQALCLADRPTAKPDGGPAALPGTPRGLRSREELV